MAAQIYNARTGEAKIGGSCGVYWPVKPSPLHKPKEGLQKTEGSVRFFACYKERPDWLCPLRAQSLQSARDAYSEYCRGYDHVLQFLAKTPSYEPQETDSLSQMETKLKNQKVRWLLLLCDVCLGGSEVLKAWLETWVSS